MYRCSRSRLQIIGPSATANLYLYIYIYIYKHRRRQLILTHATPTRTLCRAGSYGSGEEGHLAYHIYTALL
jgi:hypothetical protein